MKIKFLAALAGFIGAVIFITGCVGTVAGGKTGGTPFVKDKIEGQYERSVAEVLDAAKKVIVANGVLVKETTLHSETNTVQAIEGKVNQRNVWVRVEPVDSKVSAVTVQVRTQGGGSDIDLAHELEKQIALKLVR